VTYIGSPDWEDPRQPQGGGDLLFTGSIPVASSLLVATLPKLVGQYQRYFVLVVADHSCMVTAQIIDPTIGYGPIFNRWQSINTQATFALPALGVLGVQPQLQVELSTAASAFPVSVQCYGLRYFPESYRYDGLPPCQLSRWAAADLLAMGTVAVVPAPSSPQRILVGHVRHGSTVGVGGVNSQVFGNIGGVIGLFSDTIGITGTFDLPLSPGVLLDVGSPLNLSTSAAGQASCNVGYDIVA